MASKEEQVSKEDLVKAIHRQLAPYSSSSVLISDLVKMLLEKEKISCTHQEVLQILSESVPERLSIYLGNSGSLSLATKLDYIRQR